MALIFRNDAQCNHTVENVQRCIPLLLLHEDIHRVAKLRNVASRVVGCEETSNVAIGAVRGIGRAATRLKRLGG